MEQNQMKALRNLYKAQVELAEAYEMCPDEELKRIYTLLDNTVLNLEERLELFKED